MIIKLLNAPLIFKIIIHGTRSNLINAQRNESTLMQLVPQTKTVP